MPGRQGQLVDEVLQPGVVECARRGRCRRAGPARCSGRAARDSAWNAASPSAPRAAAPAAMATRIGVIRLVTALNALPCRRRCRTAASPAARRARERALALTRPGVEVVQLEAELLSPGTCWVLLARCCRARHGAFSASRSLAMYGAASAGHPELRGLQLQQVRARLPDRVGLLLQAVDERRALRHKTSRPLLRVGLILRRFRDRGCARAAARVRQSAVRRFGGAGLRGLVAENLVGGPRLQLDLLAKARDLRLQAAR
jgi:hypothetical protein